MSGIPDFDASGNLPPGVYEVGVSEIEDRLAWTPRRRRLSDGLKRAVANLAAAGVKRIWIDGSFVTAKDNPNDVDGCWEYHPSVDVEVLDPAFLDISPPRQAMKTKYGVELRSSSR